MAEPDSIQTTYGKNLTLDLEPCYDCGEEYWYNFVVSNDVWTRIAPKQNDKRGKGGMLCVRCIDKRCAALGIETTGRFHFKGDAVTTERYGYQPLAVHTLGQIAQIARKALDKNHTPTEGSKNE
jgi:hypothetical protein